MDVPSNISRGEKRANPFIGGSSSSSSSSSSSDDEDDKTPEYTEEMKQELMNNLRYDIYCSIQRSTLGPNQVGVIVLRECPKGENLFKIANPSAPRNCTIPLSRSEVESLPKYVQTELRKFFVEQDGVLHVPASGLNALDLSYFLNSADDQHSANVQTKRLTDERGYRLQVAVRNIQPGEELYRSRYRFTKCTACDECMPALSGAEATQLVGCNCKKNQRVLCTRCLVKWHTKKYTEGQKAVRVECNSFNIVSEPMKCEICRSAVSMTFAEQIKRQVRESGVCQAAVRASQVIGGGLAAGNGEGDRGRNSTRGNSKSNGGKGGNGCMGGERLCDERDHDLFDCLIGEDGDGVGDKVLLYMPKDDEWVPGKVYEKISVKERNLSKKPNHPGHIRVAYRVHYLKEREGEDFPLLNPRGKYTKRQWGKAVHKRYIQEMEYVSDDDVTMKFLPEEAGGGQGGVWAS